MFGAGSLQDILKFFWKHDVNMSRIESRPSKGHNQNYSFYIDFDGKRGDPAVDDLMADLTKNSLLLMVLHDKKGEEGIVRFVITGGFFRNKLTVIFVLRSAMVPTQNQ